jgi:hypothetical protein
MYGSNFYCVFILIVHPPSSTFIHDAGSRCIHEVRAEKKNASTSRRPLIDPSLAFKINMSSQDGDDQAIAYD